MKRSYIAKNIYILIAICTVTICSVPSVFAQTRPDALVLYRAGKYAEAIMVCRDEIAQQPKNLDSYVVLTWAMLANGQNQEAVPWIIQGRNISRYDPRLIESHALALYRLGNNHESLHLFEDYIAYAPNGTKLGEVYSYIGEIYLRLGQYRHADIAFSTAVQLDKLNSRWWTHLGYAREQAREYRPALQAYAAALQLNKNLIDAQKGYERVLKRF
ncbi:MAG: tetratricopeptide repeat protein [Treponema sp.]